MGLEVLTLVFLFLLDGALPENVSQFTYWNATAPDTGLIGLEISDTDLVVRGFVKDEHGHAPELHVRGGVEIGDELVAVQGKVS